MNEKDHKNPGESSQSVTVQRQTVERLQIKTSSSKPMVQVAIRKTRSYSTPTVTPSATSIKQEIKQEIKKERIEPPIIVDKINKIELTAPDIIETIIETPETIKSPKQDIQAHKSKKADNTKSNISNHEDDEEFSESTKSHSHRHSTRYRKVRKPSIIPSIASEKQRFEKPTVFQKKEIIIPEITSVSDLAKKLSVKPAVIVKILMDMGMLVTINQMIDKDISELVITELGHTAIHSESEDIETLFIKNDARQFHAIENITQSTARPPVVTIMGHVDHGKTTLLDHIRCTKVAAGEAGGITQNIGAYHVETEKGVITFLDTPGHEAFTAMRARGAKLTDIVILVVAADDGVMPQTLEAIQHAKAAAVPIIVAVNKIDKPGADPEKIKTALSHHGLLPEAWGGDVMFVEVSAKKGLGIDQLLDTILLQAEMLELKAIQSGRAKGLVIEARIDKGRGPVTTILVQQGTLKKGDILLAGSQYGRVRALFDERGKLLDQVTPSIPAEILGLSNVPKAGDIALVVPDERTAREVALFRQGRYRETHLNQSKKMISLETLFAEHKRNDRRNTLNIILKADVQGSQEALQSALEKLSNPEVEVKITASGVGGVTASDVNLAIASSAIIIAFNVRADLSARQLIKQEQVDVHYHSVIYELIHEVEQALQGLLSPEIKEKTIGLAEVKQTFRLDKTSAIVGCLVLDGVIKRGKPVRILRDNVVIKTLPNLHSLRHEKSEISEAKNHTECGIGLDWEGVKIGDQIEIYETISVKRILSNTVNKTAS